MSKKSSDSDTHKHALALGESVRDGAVCTCFPAFVSFQLATQDPDVLEALSGCPKIVLSPFTVASFPRLLPPHPPAPAAFYHV